MSARNSCPGIVVVHRPRAVTCSDPTCSEPTDGRRFLAVHRLFVPCAETLGPDCLICWVHDAQVGRGVNKAPGAAPVDGGVSDDATR